MIEAVNADLAAKIVLALLCVIAGWTDIARRRIPNWLCALTALAGLASALLLGGDWMTIGSHALHMVLALACCMVLFGLGVFGGGDAKFYSGIASWFPLGKAIALMLNVALCGLAVLIVWFTYRRIRRIPIRRMDSSGANGLPYAIAIGLGAIVTAFST